MSGNCSKKVMGERKNLPNAEQLNIACIPVAELQLFRAAGLCLLFLTVCQHQVYQLTPMWDLKLLFGSSNSTAWTRTLLITESRNTISAEILFTW